MAADLARESGALQRFRSFAAIVVFFAGVALTIAIPLLAIGYFISYGLR